MRTPSLEEFTLATGYQDPGLRDYAKRAARNRFRQNVDDMDYDRRNVNKRRSISDTDLLSQELLSQQKLRELKEFNDPVSVERRRKLEDSMMTMKENMLKSMGETHRRQFGVLDASTTPSTPAVLPHRSMLKKMGATR